MLFRVMVLTTCTVWNEEFESLQTRAVTSDTHRIHYIPFQIPLLTPHFTFLFFVSDNIMAHVASKQQTTGLFLSTIVTRTRRHAERTKKLTNLMGNLCCAREHSVQFFVEFFKQIAQFNVRVYEALNTYKFHSHFCYDCS